MSKTPHAAQEEIPPTAEAPPTAQPTEALPAGPRDPLVDPQAGDTVVLMQPNNDGALVQRPVFVRRVEKDADSFAGGFVYYIAQDGGEFMHPLNHWQTIVAGAQVLWTKELANAPQPMAQAALVQHEAANERERKRMRESQHTPEPAAEKK